MTEFAKYDSDATLEARNVRLTKDAQKISDTFVKATFVLSSKNEKDTDTWYDAIPLDSGADMAQYLRKGDTLTITGFPTMQVWGDDNKVSHTLKFCKFHYPIGLLMELNERKKGTVKGKAGSGKGGPTKKPAPAPKKDIVNLDDADTDIE